METQPFPLSSLPQGGICSRTDISSQCSVLTQALNLFSTFYCALKCFQANADISSADTGEVAMKIEGSSLVETQPPVGSVTARTVGDSTSAQGVTEDWTSFHSDSTSLQSLTSQALSFPEIRQETVDALRQSVESGQYPIDATKIASAISYSQGL